MTPADSPPPPQRGPDEEVELAVGHGAAMHAVELGVLLTGGDAPRQVERNLTELMRTGVLREFQAAM